MDLSTEAGTVVRVKVPAVLLVFECVAPLHGLCALQDKVHVETQGAHVQDESSVLLEAEFELGVVVVVVVVPPKFGEVILQVAKDVPLGLIVLLAVECVREDADQDCAIGGRHVGRKGVLCESFGYYVLEHHTFFVHLDSDPSIFT